MSAEEQCQEITRLTSQVDQLQQQLRSVTAEAERLRSAASAPDCDQVQAVKAELDHERQKAKAIWAAVRHVAGEDAVRRVEEEVSRRPIVAAPKVRRRGTMPHMPAPHMTVVAKTAATPKWPPAAQEEVNAPEVPAKVIAAVVATDHSEAPKSEFDVDGYSVPPSVARRLFDPGFKGKDQKETSSAAGEPLSLKLEDAAESESGRVADVPSPMRRRDSSTTLASVPPLPRQKVSDKKAASSGSTIRSVTPSGPVLNRRVAMETPPPPQVTLHDPTMASPATSVRDRVRLLELSARRSSIQN